MAGRNIDAASGLQHIWGYAVGLNMTRCDRQRGDLREIIWRAPEIIAQLSRQYALRPSGLIYAGTQPVSAR